MLIVNCVCGFREKSDLLSEARDLWRSTSENSYLAQDSHLAESKHEPKDTWSPTELRNWIRTRTLAIAAANKLITKGQRLITAWLLPPTEN